MTEQTLEQTNEPDPPASPQPVGALALAGLLGALLLITATFLPWVSIGQLANVSGVDVGLDGYVVLAAGVVALVTVLQLLTGRLLSRRADRPLATATVIAGCLAAGILIYFAVRILTIEAESTGSDFADSLTGAFEPAVGAGVWLGIAGAVLTVGSMLVRALRGGERRTAIGIVIAALLAAGAGVALAGSGEEATENVSASDTLLEDDAEDQVAPEIPDPPDPPAEPEPEPAESLAAGQAFDFGNDDGSIEGSLLVSTLETFTNGQGEYAEPPANGHYLVADVTFTMTSGSLPVNPFDFGIEMADGTRYDASDGNAFLSGLGEPAFESEELAAGSKLRGKIVFDVPEPNGAFTYSPGDRVIAKWLF